jgi:hypothetical protein
VPSDLPQRLAWYLDAREGDNSDECKLLRSFFALESRVHDGDPGVACALIELIAPVFSTTCRVLRKALQEVDGASFRRRMPWLN